MTFRVWKSEFDASRRLWGYSRAIRLGVLLLLASLPGCVSDSPWTSDTAVRVDQPNFPAEVGVASNSKASSKPLSGLVSPSASDAARRSNRAEANVSSPVQRVAYFEDPVLVEQLKVGPPSPQVADIRAASHSRFVPALPAAAQEMTFPSENPPASEVVGTRTPRLPTAVAESRLSTDRPQPQQMELALASPPVAAGAVRSSDGMVTISVRDTPLHALLAAIAEQQGLSIVAPSSLNVNVTVTLQPTTLESALDAIMAISNCSWSRTENVIYVTTVDKESPQNFLTQGRVMKVINLNHTSAKDVETVVTGLLSPVGRVFARESAADNKLKSAEQVVVEDLPAYVARVEDYIAQADQAPLQAIVEVRLLQVRLSDENAHGIQLEQLARGAGPEVWLKTQTFSEKTNPGAVFTVGGSHFNKVMDLLAKTTDSKTLASPRLLMINGQESRLQIGSRLAFSTSTTTDTVTVQAVEFLDVGTVLTVTPQIGDNGYILMKINPKVSTGEIDPVSKLPNEDTTELNTTILIPDGHGVIIGGLIQESDIERQTKVPWLGDIWLLGRLFQRRTAVRERTEVIVALLPRIVNSDLSPTNKDFDDLGRIDLPLLTPELQPAPRPEPSLPDAIRKPIWPKRTLWR